MSRTPFIHFIVAIVVVAAALGASAFADYRLLVRMGERERLEASIAEKRSAQSRSVDAAQLLRESAETREAVRGYFVSPSDAVGFLEGLENAAKTLGARATVVSIDNVSGPRPSMTIALEVTGSFSSIMRTLGALEYGPRDIQVTSLSIGSAAGEEGGWTAAIGLSVGAIATSTTQTP